ncbi:hypothetical protein V1264_018579 [Littorina saxatilis]|uniref:Protein NRDE2 homolog n=1 Tax=Littorina saxatilis TaxID=31220 RepID=A0AAN9BCV1_9CAEN
MADDLEWLENKSFLTTALLLTEEKNQSVPEQISVSPTPSSTIETSFTRQSAAASESSSEEADVAQTDIKPLNLKRRYSVSESDEEVLSVAKSTKASDTSVSEKKAKDKKHKKKKKKHKHKHKESRKRSPSEEVKQRPAEKMIDPSKTFIEEIPGLEAENAFRVDRSCEKSLWNYESVYKGHIARYFRLTNNCFGNSNITLPSIFKGEKHKNTVSRYYTKDKRKEMRAKGVFVAVDGKVANETAQYISIREKDAKGGSISKSREEFTPAGIMDPATSMYCQGKGAAGKESTEVGSGLDETFERTAYYNRRLHEDPSNVKLWLEFVAFQDQVFQDARFSAKSVLNRRLRDSFQPPRACIEKKVAILDKALKANPSCLELQIEKLAVEQDVTDSTSLAKQWDDLLFVHSADVRLWRHYLQFQQSRLSTFSVGRMGKLYHRCFRTLSPILEGKVKVVKMADTDNLEEEMIGVFEQYCSFLHQSGFTEKAVASYQAMIEFNLFRPPSLNLTPTSDCVAVFESFWDSGVARFGEPGAKGWAAWVENSGQVSTHSFIQVKTDAEQEEILQQDSALWNTWLKIERLCQGAHWLPWRPDTTKEETEDDCEDLDRMVLFEDVAPVLFRLRLSASCSRLVTQFLQLLGLVQQQGTEEYATPFHQLLLEAMHQVSTSHGVNVGVKVDSVWQPRTELVQFVQNTLRQSAAYFTGWYQTFFTSQLLQLQACKHGCQDVASLSEKQGKEVRKFGKNLLKETQNRNDLLLWDGYIRMEWALGKSKDALSMLQTALAMFTSSVTDQDHAGMAGLCSLYRTHAGICLNFTPTELVSLTGRKPSPPADCKKKVVASFVCLMDTGKFSASKEHTVSAAQVLKTRRKFQSILKDLINSPEDLSDSFGKMHAVQHVNCFALFELCAVGLGDSLKVFESSFQLCTLASQTASSPQIRMAIKGVEKELTHNLVTLLRNYASVEAVSLGQIRSRLDTGLSRFPDEPSLLRQLVDVESGSWLAGRLRRYFEQATREPASVYPVLFEVLAEMQRHAKLVATNTVHANSRGDSEQTEGMSDTGTVHRVRAACERGLQHKVAQHCPLLWRLYLHFEAKYGSIDRAEGIFYRALQTCPWAKVLYLDGVELFATKQFQELVDLMTEKELRVQIPLEEVELLMNSEPQDAAAEDTLEEES